MGFQQCGLSPWWRKWGLWPLGRWEFKGQDFWNRLTSFGPLTSFWRLMDRRRRYLPRLTRRISVQKLYQKARNECDTPMRKWYKRCEEARRPRGNIGKERDCDNGATQIKTTGGCHTHQFGKFKNHQFGKFKNVSLGWGKGSSHSPSNGSNWDSHSGEQIWLIE